MQRNITKSLIEWKNKKNRKPLIITGIRQCGKTYSIKEFGSKYFDDVAYFNFEGNIPLKSVFSQDFDTKRILRELSSIILQKPIKPKKTLIFFDEIQECPLALTSLKYFCENEPQLHIICAGSLLGVAIKQNNISFPVGKVEHLKMYPMSFSEFVYADDGSRYIEALRNYDFSKNLTELYTIPLEKYLKNYLIVGGMPESVYNWVNKHDYNKIDKIQEDILEDYANDFSKHAPLSEIPKLGWIWDSIPKQLAKDNNKFVFSHVKAGKRAKDLENSLQWLVSAGLVYCPQMVSKPQIPLSFVSDASYFKVYMSDVGLLRKKSGLPYNIILEGNDIYDGFKGALAENYINNELIINNFSPYFYRSDNTAEIDFIIEKNGLVIPIEVKSADNTRAKSLSGYMKKYQPKIAFKMSLKNSATNLVDKTMIQSLPLYCCWNLPKVISSLIL